MKTLKFAVSLSLVAVASVAGAKDHPAVGAAQQALPYDYASKMYPHPAGLYLLSEAPRERSQHPAILARKKAVENAAMPQLAYHPALSAPSARQLALNQRVEPGLLHPVSAPTSRQSRPTKALFRGTCSGADAFACGAVCLSAERTHASYSAISRITRHGLPAANAPSGTSRVTTLPAPTTARDPIRTSGRMIAPPPTQTSDRTRARRPRCSSRRRRKTRRARRRASRHVQ